MKRLVYMHIDAPVVFFNPVLDELSDECFELWDDCMSFPETAAFSAICPSRACLFLPDLRAAAENLIGSAAR